MIYIDPPYNTGNDFVYPDDYRDNIKNYLEITGQLDAEGRKLGTNSEASGRYHTDWLNMMYPRLKLARNLLTDDGVIFISINDNEIDNLKKICNEVFGENNFVAQLVWSNKEGGGSSDSKYFRIKHEYIFCYAKNKEITEIKGVAINNLDRYTMKDEYLSIRGPFYLQKLGMGSIQYSENLDYPIETPNQTFVTPAQNNNGKKACWRWSQSKYNWGIENDFVVIKKDSKNIWTIYTKQYLKCDNNGNLIERTQRPVGIIDSFSSTQASKYLDSIQLGAFFNYSKPLDLIKYIISLLEGKSSTILDFFSGSATTAHAVTELNVADSCNRKFIMVQLPELTNEKSEAYKAGYKTICEIGKERIRRSGEKILKENKDKEGIENLDIGFKVFKLDSSNIKKWNVDGENLEISIDNMIDNFVSNRIEEDIVYEIMLKYGIDLTYPVEMRNIADKKVFSIGFGALIICIDDEITLKVIEGIVNLKKKLNHEKTRVVFKDNGFKNDSVKTNAIHILRRNNIQEIMSI